MLQTVTLDNKKYTIDRFIDESDNVYNYRCDYIIKNKDTLSFKNLIINSKLLANMKFKKCIYEPKIYNNLKQFL